MAKGNDRSDPLGSVGAFLTRPETGPTPGLPRAPIR